ncbi:threonylcarbamoyl-AMP synthase [Coprothermobacteraceae bacterium]|nr:threonylcarbamoyl-AMP synthase [Coprothermobacteraceae bacterium]
MPILKLDSLEPDTEAIRLAASVLVKGGVVAFPTETVYGLGALALCESCVRKIFELKGRPADNPLIVHIAEIGQVDELATHVPAAARKVMERLWPGPLSIVLDVAQSVPKVVTAGLESVALRMPAHPVALELIKAVGPIAAPSANKSGRPSPTTAEHVFEDFGEELLILDAGPTAVGLESTVVDVRTVPWRIYRPGAVTRELLEEVGQVPVTLAAGVIEGAAPSPGMKYKHYSPDVELHLFCDAEVVPKDQPVTVIALEHLKKYFSSHAYFISLGDSTLSAAARIYMALRQAERFGLPTYVQLMEEEGIGVAYNERVRRAAAKR